MAQFEPHKSEIDSMGSQLLYVAAEKAEGMFKPRKFLAEHPISFPFLLDEDRTVTKACGLYHRIGKDAFNIAHPATLVVDRQGTVKYIYRGDNQVDRAPVEQVLEAVKKLSISK